MLVGYKVFYSENVVIAKWCLAILWICSGTGIMYVIFGVYPLYQDGHVDKPILNALFCGFSHVIWSASLGWIIFACSQGYGGM